MAGRYYSSSLSSAAQTSPKPSLPRSISTTDLEVTKRCQAVIQQDWCSNAPMGGTNFFTSTHCFTLTLPALTDYPPEFQQFVFDRIIDKETQRVLEGEKCLNWCPSATKLVPLYTLGDGNCLLHAASLGMWGFQDRDYILRRAVSHACSNIADNTFYRRWQYTRELDNTHCGVQLDQDQWQKEWRLVVNQASADVPAAGSLDSLEEFHIFVLANVLRRPVIMYAVPKMRSVHGATLQGVSFHGLYLPLLWDPGSCKKDPLPLSFYGGHFSSLVVVDSSQQYRNGYLVLPLTDYYGQQLPIRFILPQEDPIALLMDYLNLMQIQNHGSPYFQQNAICAKLMIAEIPAYLKPLMSGFIDACHSAYLEQEEDVYKSLGNFQSPNSQAQSTPLAVPPPRPGNASGGRSKCRMPRCRFFGTAETCYYCSKCFNDNLETILKEVEPAPKPGPTDLEETLTRRIANLELSFQDIQFDPHAQPFWAVKREEIHITDEEIGRGGWGAINVALFRGMRVAAKTLHNQIISPHNLHLFTREMNMAADVRHPNLLHFIGATTEGEPIILTELMRTSLRNVLASSTLSWSQMKSIFLDIVRALNYLHLMQPRPIIHRDLSSANVLLKPSSTTTWKAKLSDFGSTNFASNVTTTGPGNPLYAAPEAYNPYQQTPKMDIFSLGILLIETCTGQLPPVDEREGLIGQIRWPAVVLLVRRCIEEVKDRRPTAQDILRELDSLSGQR